MPIWIPWRNKRLVLRIPRISSPLIGKTYISGSLWGSDVRLCQTLPDLVRPSQNAILTPLMKTMTCPSDLQVSCQSLSIVSCQLSDVTVVSCHSCHSCQLSQLSVVSCQCQLSELSVVSCQCQLSVVCSHTLDALGGRRINKHLHNNIR